MLEQSVLQEHVWESTREAFETMINLPVEHGDDNTELETSQLVICIITFSGTMEGAFSARCTTACAEKIAKAMLMMTADDDISEPEICDAFGEVTNMLVGGFKTRLNADFPDIQISIPSVVKGLDIEPTMGKGALRCDLTVSVEGEPMRLTVIHRSSN